MCSLPIATKPCVSSKDASEILVNSLAKIVLDSAVSSNWSIGLFSLLDSLVTSKRVKGWVLDSSVLPGFSEENLVVVVFFFFNFS